MRRGLVIAAVSAAVLWTADWLILRSKSNPFGEVEVHRRYADHLKNKRIEYRFEEPHMEACVHSIFPHSNDSPCWYLERNANQTIELDGSPWHFYNP